MSWIKLIYFEKKRKPRSLLTSAHEQACVRTCELYVWYMQGGDTTCPPPLASNLQPPPKSSDRPAEVLSGFTCSVPPKHFFLPELICVPREGERANHVSRGHFQSGDGLYRRPCGGRSRKRPASKNNKSSKSARVLLHMSRGANVTSMYDQGNIVLHW